MISIIIPTYNEGENLAVVVKGIFETLGKNKIQAEVIVIDDNSPDGTGELAYYLKRFFPKLRTLHRSHRMGQLSAQLEGMAEADGNIIGFMDANGSHPPEVLPRLIYPLVSGHIDITIASRYIPEASISGLNPLRHMLTLTASKLCRPLSSVRDPLSNYFFVRKNVLTRMEIDPYASKLLLDILVNANYDTVQEVAYEYQGNSHSWLMQDFFNRSTGFVRQLSRAYKSRLAR